MIIKETGGESLGHLSNLFHIENHIKECNYLTTKTRIICIHRQILSFATTFHGTVVNVKNLLQIILEYFCYSFITFQSTFDKKKTTFVTHIKTIQAIEINKHHKGSFLYLISSTNQSWKLVKSPDDRRQFEQANWQIFSIYFIREYVKRIETNIIKKYHRILELTEFRMTKWSSIVHSHF